MRYLVIIFTFACSPLSAQLTVNEFLSSALRDPEVKMVEEQLRYLRTNPHQLSSLQRLEIRTQNRELIPRQQEFALRLTPSNPWEKKYNNLYFKTYQAALELQEGLSLKEALVKRYEAVIELAYLSSRVELLRENSKLISDQIEILKKQSGSKFFDPDDFVDLQLDLMDRGVDIDEATFSAQTQVHLVNQMRGSQTAGQIRWLIGELPDPAIMQAIADSLNVAPGASPTVAYQQQLVNLASSEYKLEKSNINTGFLQGEFDNRRREQDRTPFNISLGVTIPIVNPNKGDMAKRQLDVIEAKYELEELESETRATATIGIDKLKSLAGQYQAIAQKIDEYEKGGMGNIMSVIDDSDPRIAVRFNANIVKLKMLLIRIKYDALFAYIEFLAASDNIQQQPLRNYLAAGMDEIK